MNKKWVAKQLNEYRSLLRLNRWNIDIEFKKEDKEEIFASIDIDGEYSTATLSIFPKFWKQTKTERKKTLLHEMCHILTSKMDRNSYDLLQGKLVTEREQSHDWENTTELLTNIVYSLI